MCKSDAIISCVCDVETNKIACIYLSEAAVRLIQSSLSQLTILHTGFIGIAEPVLQGCLMGDEPTTLTGYHHLNFMVVGICDV